MVSKQYRIEAQKTIISLLRAELSKTRKPTSQMSVEEQKKCIGLFRELIAETEKLLIMQVGKKKMDAMLAELEARRNIKCQAN